MIKKAYRVKKHAFDPWQRAYVYRLDPPLVYLRGAYSYKVSEYLELPTRSEFVWVSGNRLPHSVDREETFMFACTPNGRVTDWTEIGASQTGFIDPDRVVRDTGYEVVEGDKEHED
jgi:hypothetical protein